jgi:hypothetical protein
MKKERRLLIDDTRDEGSPNIKRRVDVIVRNYWEGIRQLELNGPWDLLLLDHDLHSFDENNKEWTGYDIMCWLESNTDYLPDNIEVVSSNPSGAARIRQVITSLDRRGFEVKLVK